MRISRPLMSVRGRFSLLPRCARCGLPLTQISAKYCKRLRGFGFWDTKTRIRAAAWNFLLLKFKTFDNQTRWIMVAYSHSFRCSAYWSDYPCYCSLHSRPVYFSPTVRGCGRDRSIFFSAPYYIQTNPPKNPHPHRWRVSPFNHSPFNHSPFNHSLFRDPPKGIQTINPTQTFLYKFKHAPDIEVLSEEDIGDKGESVKFWGRPLEGVVGVANLYRIPKSLYLAGIGVSLLILGIIRSRIIRNRGIKEAQPKKQEDSKANPKPLVLMQGAWQGIRMR